MSSDTLSNTLSVASALITLLTGLFSLRTIRAEKNRRVQAERLLVGMSEEQLVECSSGALPLSSEELQNPELSEPTPGLEIEQLVLSPSAVTSNLEHGQWNERLQHVEQQLLLETARHSLATQQVEFERNRRIAAEQKLARESTRRSKCEREFLAEEYRRLELELQLEADNEEAARLAELQSDSQSLTDPFGAPSVLPGPRTKTKKTKAQQQLKLEAERRAASEMLLQAEINRRIKAEREVMRETDRRRKAERLTEMETERRIEMERKLGLEQEPPKEAERMLGLQIQKQKEAERMLGVQVQERQEAERLLRDEEEQRAQVERLLQIEKGQRAEVDRQLLVEKDRRIAAEERIELAVQLGRPDERGGTGSKCAVCLEGVADTLLIPCRHLVLCGYCYRQMSGGSDDDHWDGMGSGATTCPVCREYVVETVNMPTGCSKKVQTDSGVDQSVLGLSWTRGSGVFEQ